MKKVLFVLATLSCVVAKAQPWMPAHPNGPVKLQDVIDNHKKNPTNIRIGDDMDDQEEHGKTKVKREGKDYLFDRWVWFQQQHLDPSGYIVSPVKNLEEWQKYLAQKGQQKSAARTTSGATSNWVFQGPDTCNGGYAGLGRVNKIAPHPSNADIIYIGTAGGGVWKTVDGGHSWVSMYNNLPTMGISDIVINPLNANTIYVCTGDADGYDNYSMGVMKSIDGGVTWNPTGLSWTSSDYMWARSLAINPLDTNTLLLATNNGMYRTLNSGTSWTNVFPGDFNQVVYNPFDTTIVYAASYGSGSATSQIMRSTNGGSTFTNVTSLSGAQRIALAVCPTSPNIVKAVASNSESGLLGIYGSVNSGASFSPLFVDNPDCTANLLGYDIGLPTSDCGGQGWYDLCIAMNPDDANKVIIGGVNNYYSTDGGSTWQIVTQWYTSMTSIETVHADKHHLVYNPLDMSLYEGCDGGIYRTTDPATGTWNDLTNGMGITQFYRNAVDNGVPWCIGGAQDNGTKMVDGVTTQDLTGGDGMQPRIDYVSPTTTWYCSYPSGSIDATFDGGSTYNSISSTLPSGDWVTPYMIHPTLDNILLAGYDQLYISSDFGGTWAPSSPVFYSGVNINNIVMTYTSDSYIYLSLDNNVIKFSPDFGTTWADIPGVPAGNISRIIADPHDGEKLWVTFSGYGSNKVAEYDRTTSTWTHHNGTLPDIPVNCITIDSATGTKYIGTDVAVYYMDNSMTDWALYNTNLPAVEVTDLNINYTSSEIWAATFGRGMWKSVKNDVPTEVSVIPYAGSVIAVSPNPSQGIFDIETSNDALKGSQVHVKMIATDGRISWQQSSAFPSSGILKITTTDLAPGVYICELSNDQITARERVIIY